MSSSKITKVSFSGIPEGIEDLSNKNENESSGTFGNKKITQASGPAQHDALRPAYILDDLEFEEEEDAVITAAPGMQSAATNSSPLKFEEIQPFSLKLHPKENALEKVESLLPSLNLEIGAVLGEGNFGTVYEAHHTDAEHENCVLKIEHDLKFSPPGSKFWRASEFSLTRLNLRNTIQPMAFLLHVRTNESFIGKGVGERWMKKFPEITNNNEIPDTLFIPADQVKEFGKMLRKEFPEMEVAVMAQVMPKVPGKDLAKMISRAGAGGYFRLQDKKFRDLLNGCFCFLEDAYFANYAHLDIKPDNIIFDEKAGSVAIVDYGSGYRGMKKYNDDGSLKIKTKTGELPSEETNPRFFQKYNGTPGYLPPQVKSNDPKLGTVEKFLFSESYQSNVDAYSMGVTLLESIGANSHYELASAGDAPPRADLVTRIFSTKKSENYLESFIKENRAVERKFENRDTDDYQREIYHLLDLTFEYSKNEHIEGNFQQWQHAFHAFQKKYGYEERIDFRREPDKPIVVQEPKEPVPKAGLRGLPGGWNY